jgi:hypothetical protein
VIYKPLVKKVYRKAASKLCLLCASVWFLAYLISRHWSWMRHFLRKVGWLSADYVALYRRREKLSITTSVWTLYPTCLNRHINSYLKSYDTHTRLIFCLKFIHKINFLYTTLTRMGRCGLLQFRKASGEFPIPSFVILYLSLALRSLVINFY